jgi:hypothetical protein
MMLCAQLCPASRASTHETDLIGVPVYSTVPVRTGIVWTRRVGIEPFPNSVGESCLSKSLRVNAMQQVVCEE